MFRGQSHLERSLLEQALPLAEEASGQTLARTLTGLAWCDAQSGLVADAEQRAQRALEIADDLGDDSATCRALATLAMVASERGDLQASQRFVARELVIAESSGNLAEQARAHDNLGTVTHLRGDAEGTRENYLAAIDHYQRGIELHHRLGERQSAVRTRLNLAQACVRLDRGDEASALIRDSLATAVSLDAPWLQLFGLEIEADRRLSRGEIDVGLAYLGLFMHQPSAGSLDQHETDRILARTSLSPEAIEAGMAAGAAWDLETVIQELLRPETNV